ncbi:MAG TPA: acetolactate decarboxylase [Candidatus Marinimicrobia bacterium]|nr:acetolactate decarboxylase [Candidatus Neomarinimicrobiota bacterium]HRS51121.1 acetolactate decarboxylase [Candidatus Neomarinimicrobiota bacterium]HRU92800.1 acetolactate decarboxylase [Candidatus Neomarinimicrobiota bacterium]
MSHNYLVLVLLSALIIGCNRPNERETITQIGTIDALLGGVYDGEYRLRELLKWGDFGLGTFNALDGEMIVLDGNIYQIMADGKAAVADLNDTTPFSSVTYFDTDREFVMPTGTNFDSLIKVVNVTIPTENIFYAIWLEGKFSMVHTRSVPAQSRPYRPLAEITATQPEFYLEDVEGTIVGFRCPPYIAGVNVPGFHLHFLSADKTAGGHLLSFVTAEEIKVKVDETHNLFMILPHSRDFYKIDLTNNKQAEVEKVEK